MSAIVLLPYVHEPSYRAMRATLDPSLAELALALDNTETNLGCASSRNVGATALLESGVDWLIEISPATRFGPCGGTDFVRHLADHPVAWVVQSATPVNWHCIAWSRRLFERVGLFDENFWPVYGEDGDMSRRIHLAAAEDGRSAVWGCVMIDAWITMHGHSQRLAGVEVDHELIWRYYAAKHGGRSGDEQVDRPFGNRHYGLGFWPMPPDPRSIYNVIRGRR